MTTESLMDEKWLLTYEAITQGWVSTHKIKTIKDNEYFGLLHKHKVQFYDSSKTVNSFKLTSPDIVKVKQTVTEEIENESTKHENYTRYIATGGGGGY